MKLKKLKLNVLSEEILQDKTMNAIKGGGYCCTCSCYWEGSGGGSSTSDNMSANHNSGGQSQQGCNQYGWCGEGTEGIYTDYGAHA